MTRRSTAAVLAAAVALSTASSTTGATAVATQPERAAPAQGPPADPAASRVTVVGQGSSAAAPDVVRAALGVEVTSESIDRAFDQAGAAAEDLREALRQQGIAEQDVQTRDFSVRTREEPPSGPEDRSQVTGYVVRNLFEVTIRDVDRVGDVLAAATEATGDATRIQGLQFALVDAVAQQQQARERAFADARARAEQYADLVGRELGDLVSIEEGVGFAPPGPAAARAEVAPPPVEPGQQQVHVQVQATWRLG